MAAALPPNYKPLQHYLKTASEHDKRDVVVAYYCRLYALQKGMEIDRKSHESKIWLSSMIDNLEMVKKANPDTEAIHNEVVGQAHMEHYALQIFLYADNEDRGGRFGKNVVKSYYTAGMLFDVLSTFGDLSDDLEKNKKYAKWKAAYIHRCLKNGETPISGPLPEDGEEDCPAPGAYGQPGPSSSYEPGPSSSYQPGASSSYQPGPSSSYQPSQHLPPPGAHAPPTTPSEAPAPQAQPATRWQPPANSGGVSLTPQQYQKAMKFCKYAGSALQYEDSKTAIDNLTKALNLLTTGQE